MITKDTTAAQATGLSGKMLDKLKGMCYIVTLVTQAFKGIEVQKKDRMIHIRLSPELHKEVRIRVAEEDTSIQDWVAALIEKELERDKRK